MIKSYLHQKQKWLVTKNGVAKKQPVAEKQPSQTAAKKQLFQTPAPMQAPATNSRGRVRVLAICCFGDFAAGGVLLESAVNTIVYRTPMSRANRRSSFCCFVVRVCV